MYYFFKKYDMILVEFKYEREMIIMEEFHFIHCADLHLGCTPARLEERFYDFFFQFSNLIDYAINNHISYILVSGDFFHLKVINSKTLNETTILLEKCKENNIKVFVIEGNHDKAFYIDEESWLVYLHKRKYIILLEHEITNGEIKLPIYEQNGSIYEDENIRIIGIGYLGSSTEKYLKDIKKCIKKKNKFTVLMLHAAVNRLYGQDMGDIRKEQLESLKDCVDYIALGHIHNRYEYDELCYNPGSLENIRLQDGYQKDQKGFYDVCVNYPNKEIKYIISNYRPIFLEKITIDNLQTLDDVNKYIANLEYNIPPQSMMELSLYGKLPFNAYLIDIDKIKEEFTKKYKLLYIEVNNYINMISKPETIEEKVDPKQLEKMMINNYLDYQYPDITNKDNIIKNIILIEEALQNEEDNQKIIDMLLKMEDIL